MKIGIVWSWYEMMPLIQSLNVLEHEYHFFVDRAYWPWWEKSSELRSQRIHEGIDYLTKLGVESIIIPPLAEVDPTISSWIIVPLFRTYLHEFAFKYSLVGKIWLLCEEADMHDDAQSLIQNIANDMVLTPQQKNSKKFHQPLALWKKNVRMWTYFLTTYWRSEPFLRKTLKTDLRYFADAGVDTLVPLSRWHLFYQKIIKTRTNWKKIRFHGSDAVRACFEKITQDLWYQDSAQGYSMTLHCTDTPTPLLQSRKWMDVLSRGGKVEVKTQQVQG